LAVILSLELWQEVSKETPCHSKAPHILGDAIPLSKMHRTAPVSMVSIPRCGFTLARPMDLGERLMKHFDGDSPCIARYGPSRFVFELIDEPTAREARYRELVRQHGPVCNTKQPNQELIHRITQARGSTR
jgi:hypothetical protein